MSEKEEQFERIYKETENFGRTQFVREIQMQINDNKKKDKEIDRLNNIINEIDDIIKNHYIVGHTVQNSSIDSILKEIKQLKESGNNEIKRIS